MSRIVKWIVVYVVLASLCGGCGSPGADIGFGAGIGAALSQTIAGAKADMERREQQLVKLYNQGVEVGMEQEKLDEIEQQIIDTRLGKQTVEAGGKLLDVDWNDPKQTGGAIGLVSTLAMLWLNRKKLTKTRKELAGRDEAINKFTGTHEPQIASELHDMVKEKTTKHLAG